MAIGQLPIVEDTLYCSDSLPCNNVKTYTINFKRDGVTKDTSTKRTIEINSMSITISDRSVIANSQGYPIFAYTYEQSIDNVVNYTIDNVNNVIDVLAYEHYVPVGNEITINLYYNTAKINKVDKTLNLQNVLILRGTLREATSIVNPSIVIEVQDPDVATHGFNYCFIESFNRYYFLTGITALSNRLYRIDLRADVLMSFKNGIRQQSALIERQENNYNRYLTDDTYITSVKPDIRYYEIQTDLFETDSSSGYCYVLNVYE